MGKIQLGNNINIEISTWKNTFKKLQMIEEKISKKQIVRIFFSDLAGEIC